MILEIVSPEATLLHSEVDIISVPGVNGEFQIDMNSIVVLDIPSDESSNAKLVRHLKSNDFFNAKNHPFATFKINSSEPNGSKTLVKGDLTIKDITHAVSFLADVTVDEEVSIENQELSKSISLAPNPTQNKITLYNEWIPKL